MRASPILLAVLVVASGCAEKAPGVKATDDPTDTQASVAPDVARIDGVVVDEEELPLPNVTVGLVELNLETKTGADGVFAFGDLPAGKQSLVATRLGFEQSARAVDTKPGETTTVRIILKAVAIDTPYSELNRHTAYHNLGFRVADVIVQNQLGWNNTLCDSCQWTATLARVPNALLWEVTGTHSINKPTGPAQEWVDLRDKESTAVIWGANFALPIRLVADDDKLIDKKAWTFTLICGGDWPCFQERRDSYATFFHHQQVPEGYTALPPP